MNSLLFYASSPDYVMLLSIVGLHSMTSFNLRVLGANKKDKIKLKKKRMNEKKKKMKASLQMLFLPVAAVTSLTRSGANLLTATKRPNSYVCQMYHSTPPLLTCRLTALFSIVSFSLTLVDPRLLCLKRLIAFPVSDHSTALEHGSGAKRLRHHVTCDRFCSTAAPRLAAFGS